MDIVLNNLNMRFELKEVQKTVLDALCYKKEDLFVILPTGYGKSLLFLLPPLIMDQVCHDSVQNNNASHHRLLTIITLTSAFLHAGFCHKQFIYHPIAPH